MTKRFVDFSQLVDNIASGSHAEWDLPPIVSIEDGMVIDGDEDLMGLVIHNLIENSVKFSKPEIAEIAVGMENGAIFFRDNGVGFEQEFAHKIFLPFERLHVGADYPGTGIGLANVKRIIERHGGRVWAESAVNQGATIWIELPN